MKKLLFLFLLGVFFSDLVLGSVSYCNIKYYNMEVSHSSRKIILKGRGAKRGEVTRSQNVYPLEASIDSNVLYLDLFTKVKSVTVTVIDLNTNKNVLQEVYPNAIDIIILNLDLKCGRNYLLRLSSEKYNLIGYI